MKKTLLAALAGVAMLASLVSCGSTAPVAEDPASTVAPGSGIKSEAAAVKKPRTEMIDYQGANYGIEVPQWVIDVTSGHKGNIATKIDKDGKIVKEGSLPGTEGLHLFIATDRNENLDFLKNWVEMVGIQEKVGKTLESCVASATEAALQGENIDDNQGLQKSVENATKVMSNVRFSGLEEIATFWSQFQTYDVNGLPNKVYYEYYVVYGMPEESYKTQMKEALKGIDETTTEAKALKNKLNEEVLGIDVTGTEDLKDYEDKAETAEKPSVEDNALANE